MTWPIFSDDPDTFLEEVMAELVRLGIGIKNMRI